MIAKKLVPCIKGNHLCIAWKSEYKDGKKIFWCQGHWQQEKKKRNPAKSKIQNKKSYQQDKWYEAIYKKYNGICQETGRKLEFTNRHCAHLLPKKKGAGGYPHFALDLRNGILVSWHIHSIIDHGTSEQRKSLKIWNQIQDQRKILLEEVGLEFNPEYWENMST